VIEQLPKEVELFRSELNLLAAHTHFSSAGVDAQVAVLDHGGVELFPLRAGATEDGLDARDELARIERLRQVVVRAHLEADDLVDVLVAGAQHEDRHVGRLPDAPTDVDAVDVREHEVEDDQGGRLSGNFLDGGRARARRSHGEARLLEIHGDERSDAPLVLNDEDRLALRGCHLVPIVTQAPAGRTTCWEGWRNLARRGGAMGGARHVVVPAELRPGEDPAHPRAYWSEIRARPRTPPRGDSSAGPAA
jgi:hypothetical protein